MMGRLKHEQEQLFYEFRLDEVIPGDHLVREIAAPSIPGLRCACCRMGQGYLHIGSIKERPYKAIRMRVDPDFEDFARDCIRRAQQEPCRELRARLLILAREWTQAAMQPHTVPAPRRRDRPR
jgi:hypothetical protein